MSNDTNATSKSVAEDKIQKNIWQQNWSWIMAMIITAVTLLAFMITAGIAPFGKNSIIGFDCMEQYVPFFSEFRYKVLSGDSLFYSWDMGSGTDFYLIFAYYIVSPFNLLALIMDKSYLVSEMTIIICLKIICAAGTEGYFLSRRGEDKKNSIVITAFSVAYALSGYMCGYYMNLMWLDSILILPIIILGLNQIMAGKKPVLYILALFYSMVCNFYFSFMICIFLVLYIFTYEYKGVKESIKKLGTFALSSVLAAGMSSITLIPAVVGIMHNSSETSDNLFTGWFGNIVNLIKTQYMLTAPIAQSEFAGDVNLYASVLALVLLFVFPFVKGIHIREKIARLVILGFVFISMNNGLLNYIWHGFHVQRGIPNRFALIFIFMILELGYITLDNIRELNIKCMIPAGLLSFILPIFVYFFMDFRGVINTKAMLLLAIVSSLTYVVTICVGLYNDKSFGVSLKIISVLTLLEVVVSAILGLNINKQLDTSAKLDSILGREKAVTYVSDLEKGNDAFYREELAYKYIDNETAYMNIHGVGIFSSTISDDLLNTMVKIGLQAASPCYFYYSKIPSSPFIDDIFGVKYLHAYSDERTEEGYNIVYSGENGCITYENIDALPIGYAVNSDILQYNAMDFDASFNQNNMAELATGLEGPYDLVAPSYETYSDYCNSYIDEESGFLVCDSFIENTDGGQATVHMTRNVDKDGTYYLYLECDYYNIDISINDYLKITGDLAYQQIKVGDMKAGDKLDIAITLPYDNTSYYMIPVYMSRYDHTREMAVVQKLAEHPLTVTDYDGNSLSGNVSIGAGQMLMTTIPYSENWAVTVDGKKVESTKLMGGFLGVEMSEGDHKIEMKYTPKAFWFGLILCIVSWIMFLVYIGVVKYGKRTKPEF